MHGYHSQSYVDSFSDHGIALRLARADAWILERPIPGTSSRDAMGAYPLLACRDWRGLKRDLDLLEDRLVSLVAVPDPFGGFDAGCLQSAFIDVVRPFKRHFIVDTAKPIDVSTHHRYYARRAAKAVEIEMFNPPAQGIARFDRAYRHLVARHALTGLKALRQEALKAQLSVPGAVLFLASRDGETIAGQVWYLAGEVAYSHLTALTPDGYELRASYAIYAAAIEALRDRVRWIDLGGAAGLEAAGEDGLSTFKAGWANDQRTAYFCGRILDRQRYAELAAAWPRSSYFPAYRTAEASEDRAEPSMARLASEN